MPGSERLHVKRELLSDEEESDSQFTNCSFGQLSSEYVAIKLEPNSPIEENASSNLLHHLQCVQGTLEDLAPAPAGPAATPVCEQPPATHDASFATLEPAFYANTVGSSLIDRHIKMMNANEVVDSADFVPLMSIKDEPTSEGEQQHLSGDDTSDSNGPPQETLNRGSPKSWTQQDMEKALEALRNHHMSLTKASATYGIPSTTLWQRAHRLGIDTPKKEGASKSWSEADLRGALHALRAGAISANKASKAYGIPSSTLYKIARREGIRLAAPFNAAPTAWRRADLERALQAIRCGAASVQRAATQFGIPTGTLYGRCKREGIELSRSNPTPWSEDAMGEALEAVRIGQMSINQAAIHYNLPYSSLYGRFKRCKYQPAQNIQPAQQDIPTHSDTENQPQEVYLGYQQMPPIHTEDVQIPYISDDMSHVQYAQMYYNHCNVSS